MVRFVPEVPKQRLLHCRRELRWYVDILWWTLDAFKKLNCFLSGHYIPTLAYRIAMAAQTSPFNFPQKNFRGFLVGNPLINVSIIFFVKLEAIVTKFFLKVLPRSRCSFELVLVSINTQRIPPVQQ
jgi:hypothetical protein